MFNHRSAIASLLLAAAPFAGAIVPTVLTGTAQAQDLTPRAGPQTQDIALVGIDAYPVDREVITDACVVFSKGKITRVGVRAQVQPPQGAKVINLAQPDGTRLRAYPGLFAPFTTMGLEEIQAIKPSRDTSETGAISPEALASVAVNPDTWFLPVTRSNGVLLFGTFPSGNSIPGRASVISADGWTNEDLALKPEAGLVVQWPNVRVVRARWMDLSDDEQQKRITDSQDRINGAFRQAQAYLSAKAADPASVKTDLRWESMRKVFPEFLPPTAPATQKPKPPELPTFITAQEYDQILSALAFAKHFGLRPVIVGGRDAHLAAEQLKAAGAAVIIDTVKEIPRRDDAPYNANFNLPARLKALGVAFTIASGEETAHERNLPYMAALAVAHGLSEPDALRAVTLSAAEILGVADRVGSLSEGKDATLIITDGSPLEIRTRTLAAYINGRPIDLTNKQTVLAERYREKYRQMNEQKNQPKQDGAGAGPVRETPR